MINICVDGQKGNVRIEAMGTSADITAEICIVINKIYNSLDRTSGEIFKNFLIHQCITKDSTLFEKLDYKKSDKEDKGDDNKFNIDDFIKRWSE